MHASLHDAPAIQEGDLSTRTVRADASDAARVFFLQGWAAVARIFFFCIQIATCVSHPTCPVFSLDTLTLRTRHVTCMAAPLASATA